MPAPQKKKPKFDSTYLVPALVLGGAALLLFVGLMDRNKGSTISARSAEAQSAVNKHLSRTAEQLELQKRQMQIENSKLALTYLQSKPDKGYVAPKEGAELMSGNSAEAVARDLGVDENKQARPTDPMSMIQHQIFEEQNKQNMNEAFKKEYARQFIENARRGGYEIKLSEDYRVISVKPLRQPSGH